MLLSASSALALAAAYTGLPLGWISFAALVPLVHAVYLSRGTDSFRTGFLWGLCFFGAVLWWIALTISTYGRLPLWAAWAVFALLACYLAVFPGLWTWYAGWLFRGRKGLSTWDVLALCSAWVLLEALRGWLFSGFPWCAIAYSLCRSPVLIQSADLWGPHGIGFIVIFSNLVLWQILVSMRQPGYFRTSRASVASCAVILTGLIIFILLYGCYRLSNTWHGCVRAAAIQGSIDQSLKWDPAYRKATMDRYRQLTARAKNKFPDLCLVVWPETAVPFYFQDDSSLRKEILSMAREMKISILLGSPSYTYDEQGRPRYLNSAYLVTPKGSIVGRYDKQHLVPFGEYMPWGRLTAWARALLPTAGDFCPGTSMAPLETPPFRIGVLICFESIFPDISRREARAGANILAVITNDAWFGRTPAPFQHADMALFRAVETRRWIIRAANTGISRIISPDGRIQAESSLFRPCFIVGMVGLNSAQTPFVQHGPYWFFILNLLFILINYVNKKKVSKGEYHGKDRTGSDSD